jgi:glyceraldehyde-3-phosphate dehydrogenase (NAD(P))
MKNIAVIGYGIIGKRVADAINKQDDMKLSGVSDIISDWRIQNAVRKEYDIYMQQQLKQQITWKQ